MGTAIVKHGHDDYPWLRQLTEWGLGPWLGEPDRIEFSHKGVPCLMRRGPNGAWCGYAACEPGHPWHGHGLGYSDGPPGCDVHGGLTYAGECHGEICHVAAPGEPDNVWWLGFDCSHAWDLVPAFARYDTRALAHALIGPELAATLEALRVAYDKGGGDVYRDVAYVRADVIGLAEQIIAQR